MPDQGEGGSTRKKWKVWANKKARTAICITVSTAAVMSAVGEIAHAVGVISRIL